MAGPISARMLLECPVVYDLIVGGFGRDASIEYLRLMAVREKEVIRRALEPEALTFFDEYRRIMFIALDDVAFYKASSIGEQILLHGHLTKDILVGGGLTPMSQEFVDRVCFAAAQEVAAAAERGHRSIRIAIPCNGLSILAMEIGKVLKSEKAFSRLRKAFGEALPMWESVALAELSVHTVPEAVLANVVASLPPGSAGYLLILGTEGTQFTYRRILGDYNVHIMALAEEEQALINRAIVASIGDDPREVSLYRTEVANRIVAPRAASVTGLIVVEACTDFHFGIGVSSLEMFANAMVDSHYDVMVV